MKKLSPLMFAGTGSDVGKSVLVTAFCRIFFQDGYNPAPFKAQNMSNNSFATADGLEIGRAQAVQAEAANISPHTDMNPLLLKPTSGKVCQVVLNGKPHGNRDAYKHYKTDGRDFYRQAVCAAYDRLSALYTPVIMEGAGSISEINLKGTDIVNLPMAKHAGANVILVADIDRGGVFASVYGTMMLLESWERKLIKGIIINKFRGDRRLFHDGVGMLEELTNVPVLGVIPYIDVKIEEEDSASLNKKLSFEDGKVNIAVVLLKHISNFTDFNALEQDERINLFYAKYPEDLANADIIILPGSKNTLDDLYHLRKNGFVSVILRAYKAGKTLIGVCGGFQMMGLLIQDPLHIEGDIEELGGIGIFPVNTVISAGKRTEQVKFSFLGSEKLFNGYEIHMGETVAVGQESPVNVISGRNDGYFLNNKCFGTYIHGFFDNAEVIDYILFPYTGKKLNNKDMSVYKDEQYNLLAEHVRANINMQKIYEIMTKEEG